MCWFVCYKSECRRPFWTILGHGEALESLELLNHSRDLRSSKEAQIIGLEMLNGEDLDFSFQTFEPALGSKFQVESEFEVNLCFELQLRTSRKNKDYKQ